ncbi:glycosyl hydrolase family 28-related protein, partial [Priestia megaterium]|uniref:glycosyl hydrolase family 28-related protein n=2 Tax=Priestia TaxID=2800373 RepID=UPI003008D459
MARSKINIRLSGKFQKLLLAFFLLLISVISVLFITPEKENVYNVKNDFGVKGDGITDDTQNIQKAIDEVPTGSTII